MPCLFRDMQTKSRKGIALVLLLQVVLLPPLGSGASGEETVQSSNLLPSAAPDFLGRKTSTVSRPLIVFSTIDGGIHGLEARTGTLRWTVPSGDPVVNFAKPEEEKRERQRTELSETGSASAGDRDFEDADGSTHGATASSESTEVARMFDDPSWQEQEGAQDDFEGFIPVYSGIPGGGFLHMPEDGEWKVFERTAEQLVQLSPWYDKASRGIIVGSKETKVYALDPDSGKMSWLEDESPQSGARCRQSSATDTLVITRSMYSIKVRHAETGAFFWNVSISEFRAHSTDSDQDAGAPSMDTPLLVTSEHGDTVQAFDRESGALQWKYKLPAAAVSAHLWERKHTFELDLHAHDQAELVVASDSSALAMASSLSTVHVHKHEGGMYARLHPPMRVPVDVAKRIADAVVPKMAGALQQTSQLSTQIPGLSGASDEMLTKRNQNDAACKPRSPQYPDCLLGTYDMSGDFSWTSPPIPGVPDVAARPTGMLGNGGEGSSNQGDVWGPHEFLDIVDNAPRVQVLLRTAQQYPELFVCLIIFFSLGVFLGARMFNRTGSGDIVFPHPRLSEASSSHSLHDLPQLTPLIENGPSELQSTAEDKDGVWLSKTAMPSEGGTAMVKVESLDMSTESWNETWSKEKSCTDSDADDINAESLDQFPNGPLASKQADSNRSGAIVSKTSSRFSSNSTAKASSRAPSYTGHARGGKPNPTLHIPEPNSAFLLGQPSMKSIDAMLDESCGNRPRQRRHHSNAALSRDGSDDPDDESWAGDQPRQRSVSLGSHLSMDPSVKSDLDAALAACSSAPNSPQTTPANGKAGGSPGLNFPQWNESRYQKDFEELGRIGKGAFGSVYRVRQRLDEREYAVKKVRLDKDLTSADNQRIMREVKSFSILSDHPKIVRYYTTWKETEMPEIEEQNLTIDNTSEVTWDASSWLGDESELTNTNACEPVNWLYIQMELCSTSLRQLLNAGGNRAWTVDRERIRRYLHDVSEGLSYIHEKHYIHRDMKPDNIFIVDQHGAYVAKLGDFGLSCQTKPDKEAKGGGDVLTPLMRESSGRLLKEGSSTAGELVFSGSLSEEDMDDASLAELTRACGTRMYFSPELEHSGVYDQLVDVYALGIVIFEMMHIFKTGMERIKVIEQLKKAMCTPCANEFSNLPLENILVHTHAPNGAQGGNSSIDSRKTSSKPNTPSADKTPCARKRAFERADDSGGDSGADSPVSSPAGKGKGHAGAGDGDQGSANETGMTASRSKGPPSPLSTQFTQGSPGPASPCVGAPRTPADHARTEKMAGLLKGMALPSEVLDLFEKFEFEVCLLLRLLSQQPERRPSAQHMRDELFKSLPNDGDGDKGQEVEKLRKELAELKKQNHIKEQQEKMQGHSKGVSAAEPAYASPRSPNTGTRAFPTKGLQSSQSEADLRSLSMDGAMLR